MKIARVLKWLILGAFLLLGSACTLTPHANMGLSMDYYGGGFHVRPEVNVGVYGSP
ncbi:hypothetical protein P3T73_18420 [Kiritimatiellota bacterium B12222]|nr:hypothetical protein P3T73_18420 [Kiritimatiellota bacterium B12222]